MIPARWEGHGRIVMISLDNGEKKGSRMRFMRIGMGARGKVSLTLAAEAANRFNVGDVVALSIEACEDKFAPAEEACPPSAAGAASAGGGEP